MCISDNCWDIQSKKDQTNDFFPRFKFLKDFSLFNAKMLKCSWKCALNFFPETKNSQKVWCSDWNIWVNRKLCLWGQLFSIQNQVVSRALVTTFHKVRPLGYCLELLAWLGFVCKSTADKCYCWRPRNSICLAWRS